MRPYSRCNEATVISLLTKGRLGNQSFSSKNKLVKQLINFKYYFSILYSAYFDNIK